MNRKVIILFFSLMLIVTGCGSSNDNKENKKNEEKKVEENVTTTNSEFNKLVKEFIYNGYQKSSYKDFDKEKKKKILSKKLIAETNLPSQSANVTSDLSTKTRDLHLYQDVDDKYKMFYEIKVQVKNNKTNKVDNSRRYGFITLIEDNEGNKKLDSLQELYTENLANFND